MKGVRGAALAMALVVVILVEGFVAILLEAGTARIRLVRDQRLGIEGRLIANSAIAVARSDTLVLSLSDGGRVLIPLPLRSDRWEWHAEAMRIGPLLRLEGTAHLRESDGLIMASRGATLLLVRDAADTVRVLSHSPRN